MLKKLVKYQFQLIKYQQFWVFLKETTLNIYFFVMIVSKWPRFKTNLYII